MSDLKKLALDQLNREAGARMAPLQAMKCLCNILP